MSQWTITVERTEYVIDMRWHWTIREDGDLPSGGSCCGYSTTKKRAMRKAEKEIEQILHARVNPRQPESCFYIYEPKAHGEETAA
jgi:hypothetical protein